MSCDPRAHTSHLVVVSFAIGKIACFVDGLRLQAVARESLLVILQPLLCGASDVVRNVNHRALLNAALLRGNEICWNDPQFADSLWVDVALNDLAATRPLVEGTVGADEAISLEWVGVCWRVVRAIRTSTLVELSEGVNDEFVRHLHRLLAWSQWVERILTLLDFLRGCVFVVCNSRLDRLFWRHCVKSHFLGSSASVSVVVYDELDEVAVLFREFLVLGTLEGDPDVRTLTSTGEVVQVDLLRWNEVFLQPRLSLSQAANWACRDHDDLGAKVVDLTLEPV